MTDLKYWLWLTTRKGLGPAGAQLVLDQFGTSERAYYGDKPDFEPLSLPPFVKQSLLDKSLDGADRILGDCDRLSVRIMTCQDAGYPQRLREIAVPPAVLYIKGRTLHFDEEAAVAVVGTRRPNLVSLRRTERLAMELTSAGALVVSGIAEGLDTAAVTGAVKAGGPVVSVLAGGVDRVFPAENRRLYEDVAALGALISEYPPGTPHKGDHFNPRNRILSGLCLGVLVVECEPHGGTMLTVNHALEQGREVYAVAIGLDEQCARGTNRLIHEYKARLVESSKDILEDFADQFPGKLGAVLPPETVQARLSSPEDKPRPASQPQKEAPARQEPRRETVPLGQQKARFTDDQLDILSAAAGAALTADEIVELTQIPMKRALTAITMLQLDGALEERPGRRFYALVELEK